MAEAEDKILFGAEFNAAPVTQGVDEILNSLEKAQEAQGLLKQAIKETNTALKENRKEFDATSKALKGTFNQQSIDEYNKKLQTLNQSYDDLVQQQSDLGVAYKKTTSIVRDYNKTQNESAKGSDEISKAIKKVTSLHHFAGEEIRKVGRHVTDMAFSFVTGFAGGLVAQVIPVLIDLIGNFEGLGLALDETAKRRKTLNEIFSSAAQGAGAEIAKLEVFKTKLNDTNIPAAERIRLAKEYNKTADEGNKIDVTQINNLEAINTQLEKQNKLIIARAISTAALSKLTEKATEVIDAQLKLDQEAKDAGIDVSKVRAKSAQVEKQNSQAQMDAYKNSQRALDGVNTSLQKNITLKEKDTNSNIVGLTKQEGKILGLIKNVDVAQKELNDLGDLLNPLISVDGLTTKTTAATHQIENVFAQKLAELKAKLSSITLKTFQSEGLIRQKFEDQLEKDYQGISKLLKENKLITPQADILKGLLKQINDIELTNGLKEFRDKQAAALKTINDELLNVQLEDATKRAANIQDEFQREQAQLDQNFEQANAAITKRQTDLLKKVDDDTKAGLLSPQVAKRKKFMIRIVFGDLLDQAEQANINAQLELAFKTFQKTLEQAKQQFDDRILSDKEETTQAIREQVALYLQGKISYERLQKEMTRITKIESHKRRLDLRAEAQDQLDRLNKELEATNLTGKQRETLTKQRDAVRNQIADMDRETFTADANDQQAANQKKLDNFLRYVKAVQDLGTAVLNFWQQVNQAEAAALDRSIALQNKRVENAKEIADKGNAEFLEQEQKRLDELQTKREANARKQIAINNALTASQAIVAAISAIAQAVSTGSPIAAIAAVAAVIGAIGAAYSFVNSLQPQSADFFEGTPFVTGPEGKDKVPANLTRGERVVTKDDNEAYWPALEAMRRGIITPEDMNAFVQQYPVSGVPTMDFERLNSATEGKAGIESAELLNRVDRLNGTMEQVVVGLSEIGVNVNMDENGLEVSISRARTRRILKNRS